ncbi:MAG TPA: DNA repair ATPase [Acidobacteriota bacterium]|nr:DNA repair ATPase [Acidobacteriota bacterium]
MGNERIRTENNCVPRDLIAVGSRLLFGYNVFIGLRRETRVGDVLTLHRFGRGPGSRKAKTAHAEGGGGPAEDGAAETSSGGSEDPSGNAEAAANASAPGEDFVIEPLTSDDPDNFLSDEKFVEDFAELYRYYKDARLLQLRNLGSKLLAVFQIGESTADVRVFRWSVDRKGEVSYIDNRGERDHVFPPSHDFEWTPVSRDDFISGLHPHISILDEVFVETVGGDLTVKIENNTEDGLGIYREPVEDPDQSLDDAEVSYAKLGVLILLKILPYREEEFRYLVFNSRTQEVERIDAIGRACRQLPEDHGIIFPGGYYLQSGEHKVFAGDTRQMEYKRLIRSPNGEDVLYVFHRRDEGRSLLLNYNLIRKEASSPIHCHGFGLFPDGTLIVFRSRSNEPTRVHPMQIWRTPFVSDEHEAAKPATSSGLGRVGNAELVRGISDALGLRRAVIEQEPSRQIYEDLIRDCTRLLDSYYWFPLDEVGDVASDVREIRDTAELIIDEYEKQEGIKQQAAEALKGAQEKLRSLVNRLHPKSWSSIDPFVEALADLRRHRGHLITLADMRAIDQEALKAQSEQTVEHFDRLSQAAVDFLQQDQALQPYRQRIEDLAGQVDKAEKTTETKRLREKLDELNQGLDLLTEVVNELEIEDATVRADILERISDVLAALNRARALLENRRQELLSSEGRQEFAAQFKLFSQHVSSALAQASTPQECDEQLSRLLLQLEDMESRFGEFGDFREQLELKREDVSEVFASRKQRLLDERQRRAEQLQSAAGRILDSIRRRAASISEEDELNAFFASDPMIGKSRQIVSKLREAGESVRADEIESRLKALRQESGRSLRDRRDIFEEGDEVIRLGRHRFSVNKQELQVTLVPRDEQLWFHLTGTGFYEPLDDPAFENTRPFWDQTLVSETDEVYRGEFLAASILALAEEGAGDLSLEGLRGAALEDEGLLKRVRRQAAERYDEGYERGVHDADGAKILAAVLELYQSAGLLRFAPLPRALAALYWANLEDEAVRLTLRLRARNLGRLRSAFARSPAIAAFASELSEAIGDFLPTHQIDAVEEDIRMAGLYLFEELCRDPLAFAVSKEAVALRDRLWSRLKKDGTLEAFQQDLNALSDDLGDRWNLTLAWLRGMLHNGGEGDEMEHRADLAHVPEAAAYILCQEGAGKDAGPGALQWSRASSQAEKSVEGLLGQHPRIKKGVLRLRLDEFLARLSDYRLRHAPAYRDYLRRRHQLLQTESRKLRLEEFRPRVLSGFVRNQLIDQVYLPLIGDNLAKQLGALGEGKRADQMGLLLLISPPGYGKTTLMEYIADRLGLVFMKINGPALGHSVTSLDPGEAPNATARKEIEKLNLGLEMGNNVLLYVDDIQHTHPEFLQKFISLCDAQRRVEGVWKGETRTYDLRGKRFCVCMAGNPYTEAGERFRIPDMLANRADIYNLGDILEGRDEAFALSYIENSLTSNSTLAPLASGPQDDVYKLVRMAQGQEIQADQLSHSYTGAELDDILSVLKKLIYVQQTLLKINRAYIHSASQSEDFRKEPAFRLQGSYRNMNKLAERVVPVMNQEELENLLDDHYQGEAQTLTTGAESNLLKLAELRDRLTESQSARWTEIKNRFNRLQSQGGPDDDPVTRVVAQLNDISTHLDALSRTLTKRE